MKASRILTLVLFAVGFVNAQNPRLEFEAASVRPMNTRPSGPVDRALGCRGSDGGSPGTVIPVGRCIARYEPLRMVIALAYDIPPASMYPYEGQVLSGPDWINREVYNIEAKADAPATQAQLRQMLQALLAERFKLKVHRELREMPAWALVAKNGAKGVKFQSAPKDRECGDQRRRDHRYELGATTLTGHCHAFVPGTGEVMIEGRSVEMADLAEMLSIWAERIVVDKTGVQGLFDVKLPRFMPPQMAAAALSANIAGGAEGARVKVLEAQISLPTLNSVLDQMGLKLESTKAPVEVIVIDSVERPTEN